MMTLDNNTTKCGLPSRWLRGARVFNLPVFALALAFCACEFAAAQTAQTKTDQTPAANPLPVPASQPQNATPPGATPPATTMSGQNQSPPSQKPANPSQPLAPCEVKNAGAPAAATGASHAVPVPSASNTTSSAGSTQAQSKPCPEPARFFNWYTRFVTGPKVVRFSPEQKLRLALDNLINPWNLATIFGEAGIEVSANSHTAYGPGFPGWGRLSGVNFTQDMTDQFFGTFLVPTITRTDPHYHRRPDLSIPRRALHCVDQTFWQRADNGSDTLNYSQIVAPVFDIAISNLYVPGQQTHFSADAERYGVDLATAPIDNLITEFVPSIAGHIHVHVVFVQRIINHVATNPP